MNSDDSRDLNPTPASRHDGEHNDRSLPVSTFRLPHETSDSTPRAPRQGAPRVAPSPSNGSDDVHRAAQRRANARRGVSGLSIGLVIAAGVGVGGLTWAAQQASAGTTTVAATTGTTTAATTDTSSDDTTTTASTSSTVSSGTTGTGTTSTGTTAAASGVTVSAASGTANASTSAS